MSGDHSPPRVPKAFLEALHNDLSPRFPVHQVLAAIDALRADVAELKEAVVGPPDHADHRRAGSGDLQGLAPPDMKPTPYTCKFCGLPSQVPPEDQEAPPDYCHDGDHISEEEDDVLEP